KKRITGPEFKVGSWKWRILLFPSGDDTDDYVSIYLDFADSKTAPSGWHACVQFALVLWNPEDPTQHLARYLLHRFTAEQPDWGFAKFYELQKLFTPSEGQSRSLIENNSIN